MTKIYHVIDNTLVYPQKVSITMNINLCMFVKQESTQPLRRRSFFDADQRFRDGF